MVQNFEFHYFILFYFYFFFYFFFFFFWGGGGSEKIIFIRYETFVDILGGHRKILQYLGVISILGSFLFKVKVQNGDFFFFFFFLEL